MRLPLDDFTNVVGLPRVDPLRRNRSPAGRKLRDSTRVIVDGGFRLTTCNSLPDVFSPRFIGDAMTVRLQSTTLALITCRAISSHYGLGFYHEHTADSTRLD